MLKVAPDASNALAWRGQAYQGLGEPERAVADFKAALALDPKQPNTLEGLKALEPSHQ